MYMILIRHVTLGMLTMEEKDREIRFFSTKAKGEQWLKENGFFIGAKEFFKGDPVEWCREGEQSWDHFEIDFKEYQIDDVSASYYKRYRCCSTPWDTK